MSRTAADARSSIRRLFGRAHCAGALHVRDLDRGAQLGLAEDSPAATASVFKVQVAVEFFRQVAEGILDPAEQITIGPGEHTPGPVGISLFADPVRLSLRDLATMMLTLSDNTATDAIIARVGILRVQRLGEELGLGATWIGGDVRWMLDTLAQGAGLAHWEDFAAAGDSVRALIPAALAPERTTRTTARDATGLLEAIWADRGAPPEACAAVRELMAAPAHQTPPGCRLPRSAVVSAKSGSLAGLVRNEIGVVELAKGRRFAVAVFVTAWRLYQHDHAIDRAIGMAARIAVDSLT